MRFIKMPNNIFDYPLSPNGFRVYTFLISRVNALQTVVISYEKIAEACYITSKTAFKAIDELEAQGLVHKEHRYNILGYAKNKYFVNRLPGRWFKVDATVMQSKIKSTDFVVYCYIKKCMDSKKEEAFPSLNMIAKGTGISHSRVSTAVKYLREHTYLNRVKRHYRKTKAFRHNRYLHFRINTKTRRVRRPKHTLLNKILNSKLIELLIRIIEWWMKNVKSYLYSKGSIIFT